MNRNYVGFRFALPDLPAYGLRGFDAVRLSSAKLLKSSLCDIDLSFSSFDEKLNNAAGAEKLSLLLPPKSR